MTKTRPLSNTPPVAMLSSGLRLKRNHSTSIGAPKSSAASPALSRNRECRPSQPTVSSRADVERAFRRGGAHAGDAAALDDQAGRLGLHLQLEAGIAPAPVRR